MVKFLLVAAMSSTANANDIDDISLLASRSVGKRMAEINGSPPAGYALEACDKKCPYQDPTRLWREEGHNLISCAEKCSNNADCKYFSFADTGRYEHVCMGCTTASFDDHRHFKVYAKSRLCTEYDCPVGYVHQNDDSMNFQQDECCTPTCAAYDCPDHHFNKNVASTDVSDTECCQEKTCSCTNGVEATGAACPTHGDTMCVSCHAGYILSQGMCEARCTWLPFGKSDIEGCADLGNILVADLDECKAKCAELDTCGYVEWVESTTDMCGSVANCGLNSVTKTPNRWPYNNHRTYKCVSSSEWPERNCSWNAKGQNVIAGCADITYAAVGGYGWLSLEECKELCAHTPNCNYIEWSPTGTSYCIHPAENCGLNSVAGTWIGPWQDFQTYQCQ